MNALIFKDKNEAEFIPFGDPKAIHIKEVLKMHSKDELFAGIVNEKLFKTKIIETCDGYKFINSGVQLDNPERQKLVLCVPFTRPQIAKRIMFEASCFGVEKLVFYVSNKGEEGYLKSSLYEPKQVEESLIKGAEQACSTFIPKFYKAENLTSAIDFCKDCQIKIAPDLYEASDTFFNLANKDKQSAIIFGGERGFSNSEREILRESGFTLVSLGKRVLRTDTAIIASLSIFCNSR